MRSVFGVESSADWFDTLCEEATGWGTEHGWAGLEETRPNVEQLVKGRLSLREEHEHGRLGPSPESFVPLAEQLEGRLTALVDLPFQQPAPVRPAVLGGFALVLFLSGGAGSSVGLPLGASIVAGCVAAALAIAVYGLSPARLAVAGTLWIRYQIAALNRSASRARQRHTLADTWVGARLPVTLATFDLSYVRARYARRVEGPAVRPTTDEGVSNVLAQS